MSDKSRKSAQRAEAHGLLTIEHVRRLICYDPSTGLIRSRVKTRWYKPGTLLGHAHPWGYIFIYLEQSRIMAHRLAWFYMTGKWPEEFIDHINGRPSDNRWVNIREATAQQNNHNNHVCRSASGLKGVYWSKRDRKYRAQIKNNGKLINLGRFADKNAAHSAYLEAKRALHPFHSMFLSSAQ